MYIYESQRDNTGGVLYNITTIGIIFYIVLSVYAQLLLRKMPIRLVLFMQDGL